MEIRKVDRIGIRVTDEARTLVSYRQFGFDVTFRAQDAPVAIVRDSQGVEINFIVNGTPPPEGKNVLMDVGGQAHRLHSRRTSCSVNSQAGCRAWSTRWKISNHSNECGLRCFQG